MLSKEELLAKDIPELESIAQELEAEYKPSDDKETIIYAILDKQAIAAVSSPKRKRTRIAKKDTDRVYSVNGKEGENFDVKKNKPSVEAMPLFKDEVPAEPEKKKTKKTAAKKTENAEEVVEAPVAVEPADVPEEKPAPKKRGRKSKAELAAIAAAEEARKAAEAAAENEEPVVEETPAEEPFVPEAAFGTSDGDEKDDTNLLEQLQAKVNAHNEAEAESRTAIANGIWEGDPGDGTDFITVIDLPIEDQGALPSYDIFDNPTTPVSSMANDYLATTKAQKAPAYNFEDLIAANGVLEVMPDGYGFLRSSDYNYLSSPDDVYVSTNQIKRYNLKTGDVVECHVRPPHDGEKYFPLTSIDKINGRITSEVRDRIPFEHLTPYSLMRSSPSAVMQRPRI